MSKQRRRFPTRVVSPRMRVPVIWSLVLGVNIAALWIIATLVVAHFTVKYW